MFINYYDFDKLEVDIEAELALQAPSELKELERD